MVSRALPFNRLQQSNRSSWTWRAMERILRTIPNPGGPSALICEPVLRAEGLCIHLPARRPNRSQELPPTGKETLLTSRGQGKYSQKNNEK
ncbi:hypothetical protein I7I50_05407 [Histoplasma capsulatum G186AR]|uniref:Uncharacterized protein n=1 Tax=Ajellomyces capsulatus TaxID=5037 RepID=A0A8H7ZCA4_AJECA|nr:hypothetical protein I7I52_03668 [Histoplasma capsulatum]QSS76073.1 hypothetical protein I7I50_05407 [Histoplasma capsulatum G186AR]